MKVSNTPILFINKTDHQKYDNIFLVHGNKHLYLQILKCTGNKWKCLVY
jgi:hypothetical protein